MATKRSKLQERDQYLIYEKMEDSQIKRLCGKKKLSAEDKDRVESWISEIIIKYL